MKPVVIIEDEGGPSLFADRVGDKVVLCSAFKETFVPVGDVPAFAQRMIEALYSKAGLPVPELASQIGADNSGQQRTTSVGDWEPYTDPHEAAQAAAWAGDGE